MKGRTFLTKDHSSSILVGNPRLVARTEGIIMRRYRQLGIIIAGVILTTMSVGVAGEASVSTGKKRAKVTPDQIDWMRYDRAMEKAREENKHLFVDFTATWCGWCKKLEKDTFSKPEVIKILNENFVSSKVWNHEKEILDIDGYKIAEKDLGSTQFGVRSFPTMWFISPDGQKIGPVKGYLNAEQFMKVLNFVKDYEYLVASAEEEKEQEKPEE